MLRKILSSEGAMIFALGFGIGGALFGLLTTYCFIAAYNGNLGVVRDTVCVIVTIIAGGVIAWRT